MKYNDKQRLNMAYHGVDADELENPKQKLPPVKNRIEKLKRYIEAGHPRSAHYKRQLEIYKTLMDPDQRKKRGLWQSIFRG